jgi:hypothetical protein
MPDLPISEFYQQIGYPLRNVRTSWGARGENGIVLTVWQDDVVGRYVRVLGPTDDPLRRAIAGFYERVEHLRLLWAGGMAGYAVIATSSRKNNEPRTIESYDPSCVYRMHELAKHADGSIWALLDDAVPVARLAKHSQRYRLEAAEGTFPHIERRAPASTTPSYVRALPGTREMLIEIARRRDTISYEGARKPFGLRTFEHRHLMDRLGNECLGRNEPILTALIIDPLTGRCSAGFEKEFHRDDRQERSDCYEFWAITPDLSTASVETKASASDQKQQLLRDQALRFAAAAIRPDQAAFRRRVFLRYRGTCAVSGCAIRQVLDAAHRVGRDWRLGHNSGRDGLLLRKDLHALYDANLMSINDSGCVSFDINIRQEYAGFEAKQIINW